MRSWVCRLLLLMGVTLLPTPSQAQPILLQRCVIDSLDAAQAEARLMWARRCALTKNVRNPGAWFDTGMVSATGGTLKEYVEDSTSSNWSGQNCYTSQSDNFEVNYSFISKLYLSSATSEDIDPDGYYRWSRPLSRKKLRPLYPTFSNQYDIYSPSSIQLFPHPTLANCGFYYDKNGTQPATGSNFFINGFCESSGATALSNGTPVTSLSGTSGQSRTYSLSVPEGVTNVAFATSGGTGDVDLYVRREATPTSLQYDCRPYRGNNNERCYIPTTSAGTWYVMLNGHSSYSDVTLKAAWNVLLDEVPVPNLAGAQNSERYWTMDVPAGLSSVSFTISSQPGTAGDADLYVKYGSAPNTTTFDCRPYIGGNDEVCTFTNPAAGTWYVMIRGWSSYGNVSLTGRY